MNANDAPIVPPLLERRQLTADQQQGFLGEASSVAVTDGGVIGLLAPDRPTDPVLLLIRPDRDSSMRVLRKGMGPGELSGAGMIFSRGDTFDIVDLGKQVLMTVTADGRVAREGRLEWSDAAILAVHADSVDVIPIVGAHAAGILRRPRIGSGERQLISPNDPALASWLARYAGNRAVRTLPVFHASSTQLLLGQGHTYELAVYSESRPMPDVFGRELPPRRRTEAELTRLAETLRLASGPDLSQADLDREIAATRVQELAHFQFPGGWIDGAGRVWIVGEASDSTFVDFFANGEFLDRTMLPCPDNRRRIGHSEHWLVLICGAEPASDSASTVELQLYRVRDTTAASAPIPAIPRP